MGLMPDIYDEADDYRKACGERYEKIQELEAENKRLLELYTKCNTERLQYLARAEAAESLLPSCVNWELRHKAE